MSVTAGVLLAMLAISPARAADISCTVYIPISKVNVGQQFTVEARIFDSGGTDVNYVAPCPTWIMVSPPVPDYLWLTSQAGGAAVQYGSPQPQPQVTAYLVPGQTTAFTWTYVATAAGSVDFTVSAMGREVGGPGFPRAMDTVTIQIQNPARLSATVTTSSPGLVRYGDTVTVYLDVFNFGDAAATATARFSITLEGTGRLTPLSCPPLSSLCPDDPGKNQATIKNNSATLFTWLYRATVPGTVTIRVDAAGFDNNEGKLVVSNSASTTFAIPAPSVLSYTVTGAEGLVQGAVATYRVSVANLGTTMVCQSGFDLVIEDQGAVRPAVALELRELGDSLLPICYEPGQVRNFTVRFVVPSNLAPGTASLSLAPLGQEAWTGIPAIGVGSARPLFIVAGKSGFCGFSENPWRPRRGPLAICYAVAPDDGDRLVSVSVYTIAGELVRELESRALPTGVYPSAWDGRNSSGQSVASGVYVLLFRSYLSKDTRKLAVLQ